MRLLPLSIALAAALPVLTQPGCAGCSEECSGDNQGAETCPCASDQDCTTELGTVLLCVEGVCAVEDPPAAPAALGACDDDGQCGDESAGLACGIDDICMAAARCQRIDAALVFQNAAGDIGGVTATRADCEHTWDVNAGGGGRFTATFTINLSGDLVDLQGCEQGRWFTADRVGELVCDGVRWAVAAAEPAVRTCVVDCADPCELVGEAVGVCP